MNWHEFIFSEKPSYRIWRHLIFWLLWWLYFTVTYYYYLQVGLQKIVFGDLNAIIWVESFLLILIHIVACYFFIYILLPKYLIEKKYLPLTIGITLVAIFLLVAGYVIHNFIFPLIDPPYLSKISSNNTLWWTNINSGLLNGPKVIAAATAIKLVKRWYLKQKEKERVEKEKLVTDLQLMKAQIRPGFLFSSLDQIYESAQKKSVEAPELLLRLSDLLSYLLYECDEPEVSLEKELDMMKQYMALERNRYGRRLELETVIKGDMENKRIAPLLLLPFIENSFKHCSKQTEQPWINLQVSIENEMLLMKLINGIDQSDEMSYTPGKEVLTVQKRLELLYPGMHELKMYAEHEIFVVYLKINLQRGSGSDVLKVNKTGKNGVSKTEYAI
jgi:sensor histidine kinase YesM